MARPAREVVITGLGVVSPIGIGLESFARSLSEGASGVRRLSQFTLPGMPTPLGAEIPNFDPKEHIKPRKSIKVMSREIQIGFAAADQAIASANLPPEAVAPDRKGVLFGCDLIQCAPEPLIDAFRACSRNGGFDFAKWAGTAMPEVDPLWLLRFMPNMAACHVGISHDARGPCNSICQGAISSLTAIAEGARLIERDVADVMIVGGTGSRLNPTVWVRGYLSQVSRRFDEPEKACRPFDVGRDGLIAGEGAAAIVLESARHAQRRGATPLARVLAHGCVFRPPLATGRIDPSAIRRVIEKTLTTGGISAENLGHVNAHGQSTDYDDIAEAQAIRASLADTPVTAPKSYFGDLGSGSGAVELVASVLALREGRIPVTLNTETIDPACPIQVVKNEPRTMSTGVFLALNHNDTGQAVALLLERI